jgi:hypothetical protein
MANSAGTNTHARCTHDERAMLYPPLEINRLPTGWQGRSEETPVLKRIIADNACPFNLQLAFR